MASFDPISPGLFKTKVKVKVGVLRPVQQPRSYWLFGVFLQSHSFITFSVLPLFLSHMTCNSCVIENTVPHILLYIHRECTGTPISFRIVISIAFTANTLSLGLCFVHVFIGWVRLQIETQT